MFKKINNRFVKVAFVLGIVLALAGVGTLCISSAKAAGINTASAPALSGKITVDSADSGTPATFYNYADFTGALNPKVTNTSSVPTDIVLQAHFPLKADSTNVGDCLLNYGNTTSKWQVESASYDSDKKDVVVKFRYATKLAPGKTTELLFKSLHAIDNLTADELTSLPEKLSVSFGATLSYTASPDAPDNQGGGSATIEPVSDDILVDTGDNLSLALIEIGVLLLLCAASILIYIKHGKRAGIFCLAAALLLCGSTLGVTLADAAETSATAVVNVNLNLELEVDKETFTVTFDDDDSDSGAITDQILPKNSLVKYPGDPIKEGYKFTGFNDASTSTSFDFKNTRISEDITLVAQYQIEHYTLTFVKGKHGLEDNPESRTIEYGASLGDAPELTESLYYLVAWCTDPACTAASQIDFAGYKMPAHDLTLYALWAETYSIGFDTFDKCAAPAPFSKLENNATLGTLKKPIVSATGYTFDGWFTDRACTNEFVFADDASATKVSDNLTLYAKWTPKTDTAYEIHIYKQDVLGEGYTEDISLRTSKVGTTDDAPTYTADSITGFTNVASKTTYSNSSRTNPTKTPLSIAPDGSLVINLYYVRDTLTVSFDNAGKGAAPSSQSVRYHALASYPGALSQVGYNFDGWYKDSTCRTPFDFSKDIIDSDTTIYASWSPAGNTSYKINYYIQNISDDTYTLKESDNRLGTTDAYANYIEKSWAGFTLDLAKLTYSDSSHKTPQSTQLFVTADGSLNINLYYLRDSHNVIYNSNNHGVAPANTEVKYGAKVSKPEDPTCTGYTFGGWYSDAACSEAAKFDFNSSTMGTQDIHLYAKWTINEYQLSFAKGEHGVEDVPSGRLVTYNTTTTAPSYLSEDGYIQVGWAMDEAGTEIVDFSTFRMPAHPVVMFAVWQKTYFVYFNMLGHGTQIQGYEGLGVNARIEKPQDPTADGYTFDDWYLDEACTRKFDFSTPINQNMTLYARWNPNENTQYKIEYYLQNVDDNAYTINSRYSDTSHGTTDSDANISPLQIEGFRYIKERTTYRDSKNTEPISSHLKISGDGSLIISVYYDRITYNANFVTGGKGTTPPAQTNVRFGAKIKDPGTLTQAGYVHEGWFSEAAQGNQWNFSDGTMPASDLTLYAHWTSATDTHYSVRHFKQNAEDDNYTLVSEDTESLSGATDSTPLYSAKNYTGFAYDGSLTTFSDKYNVVATKTPLNIEANGSLVINMYYKRNVVNFNFNNNQLGTTTSSQRVKYGAHATEPDAPTAVGYTFTGWYKDVSCSDGSEYNFGSETVGTDDVTVYAKWTINSYDVNFDKNGHGIEDAPAKEKIEYKAHIVAPTTSLTDSGWILVGWASDAEGLNRVYFDEYSMPAKNVTLYAIWAETFYIDFNMCGHGIQIPTASKIDNGATVTKPTDPEAKGYTFGGWYSDQAYTTQFDFTAPVTDNHTIYAKWTPRIDTAYKVLNYQQNLDDDNYTLVEADTQELTGTTDSNASYSAKTYAGFSYDSTKTTYEDSDHAQAFYSELPIKGDGSLVIKRYYNREKYDVTFDNGGYATIQSAYTQNLKYGSKVTVPISLSEAGFVFDGWFTSADGSTPFDFDNSTVTGATTIYAHWHPITYSVQFYSNGGSGTIDSQEMTYGVSANLTKNNNQIKRKGYTFAGWNSAADGSGTDFADEESVTNLTTVDGSTFSLYAVWEQSAEVTLSFDLASYKFDGVTPQAQGIVGGSISPADPQSVSPATGTPASVSATPATGFDFVGWYVGNTKVSGDAIFTPEIDPSVGVFEETTYTAHFKEQAQIKISFKVSTFQKDKETPLTNYIGGKLTLSGATDTKSSLEQLIFPVSGSASAVSAASVNDNKFKFDGWWSVDSEGNETRLEDSDPRLSGADHNILTPTKPNDSTIFVAESFVAHFYRDLSNLGDPEYMWMASKDDPTTVTSYNGDPLQDEILKEYADEVAANPDGAAAASFTQLMNQDNVHLFTMMNGKTYSYLKGLSASNKKTDKNVLEARIVSVNPPNKNTCAGLTFQSIHCLPNGIAHNNSSGGWASSAVRSAMNTTNGSVYKMFKTDFMNSLTTTGIEYAPSGSSRNTSVSNDKMWIASYSEFVENVDVSWLPYGAANEGRQFEFWKGKITNNAYSGGANSNTAFLSLLYQRGSWGTHATGYSDSYVQQRTYYGKDSTWSIINSKGGVQGSGASNVMGVDPCFNLGSSSLAVGPEYMWLANKTSPAQVMQYGGKDMKDGDLKAFADAIAANPDGPEATQAKQWMNQDSVHLYTYLNNKNWNYFRNLSVAQQKDDMNILESRIVAVNYQGTDTRCGLTLQAVHCLSDSYAHNNNSGGWGSSSIRSAMNSTSGAIYKLFKTSFINSIVTSAIKYGTNGGNNNMAVSNDKLWLASYREFVPSCASAWANYGQAKEGVQFSFWNGKVTNSAISGATNNNTTLLSLLYQRGKYGVLACSGYTTAYGQQRTLYNSDGNWSILNGNGGVQGSGTSNLMSVAPCFNLGSTN